MSNSTISLDGKTMVSVTNSDNGDVGSETLFRYRQEGLNVSAVYNGGAVLKGHLLGRFQPDGTILLFYHHIDSEGTLKAGRCESSVELLSDGRIKLHERWQWLTGDQSSGYSEVVELLDEQ